MASFKDSGTHGVIWAAQEKDDPFSEATQRKANPGFGISPTREYLEAAANKAKTSPVELATYKRLHLGIRSKKNYDFLPLQDWRRNAGSRAPLAEHAGRLAYGGMDLASVSDLSAVCYLLRKGGTHEQGYFVHWRFWTPEENLQALDKSTADEASAWVKNGWLELTPGDVTDYEFIKTAILSDAEIIGKDNFVSLGYDPWNATQIAIDLEESGVPMVETRQGYRTQSPALKEVLRLTRKGKKATPLLEHGGNPLMEWMISNLAVDIDPAGNVKPNKAKSTDKIDGISALTNAMSEAMITEPEARSAYAELRLGVAGATPSVDEHIDEFGLRETDYI